MRRFLEWKDACMYSFATQETGFAPPLKHLWQDRKRSTFDDSGRDMPLYMQILHLER